MINEVKRVLSLINALGGHARRSGRTRAIIDAARKINATILAANSAHVQSIRSVWPEDSPNLEGLKVTSIHAKLHGTKGPFLLDHYTMECVAFDALEVIRELEVALKTADEFIEVFGERNEHFKRIRALIANRLGRG